MMVDTHESRPHGPRKPSFPWMAVKLLIYFGVGAYGIVQVGLWRPRLLIPILLFVFPLLLRIALVYPLPRPVIQQHPYIARWIYGLPVLALGAALLLVGLAPLLGGSRGFALGFQALLALQQLPPAIQAAGGLGCFALAGLLVSRSWQAVRSEPLQWAVFRRPVATIVTLLVVPLCGGLGLSLLSMASELPGIVLRAGYAAVQGVYLAETVAAILVVYLVFPAAAGLTLVRSYRTLIGNG